MLSPSLVADHATLHTRKAHNGKRTRVDGVWLTQRSGQRTYLAYHPAFGVTHIPSLAGAPEQLQCRLGDSGFTIEGRNLWPLMEALTLRQCASLREADPAQAVHPVLPSIERITGRLWL